MIKILTILLKTMIIYLLTRTQGTLRVKPHQLIPQTFVSPLFLFPVALSFQDFSSFPFSPSPCHFLSFNIAHIPLCLIDIAAVGSYENGNCQGDWELDFLGAHVCYVIYANSFIYSFHTRQQTPYYQ